MKGDAKVIAVLSEVLKAELTAINQYFLHAEMCENWGYEKLAKHTRVESIEEMQHAEKLIEHILYLDGTPNMSDYFKINIGQNVKQQLEFDLQVEYDAVKRLNTGIETCVKAGDNGSRDLLEGILTDEEEHIDWLEGQLTRSAKWEWRITWPSNCTKPRSKKKMWARTSVHAGLSQGNRALAPKLSSHPPVIRPPLGNRLFNFCSRDNFSDKSSRGQGGELRIGSEAQPDELRFRELDNVGAQRFVHQNRQPQPLFQPNDPVLYFQGVGANLEHRSHGRNHEHNQPRRAQAGMSEKFHDRDNHGNGKYRQNEEVERRIKAGVIGKL